MRRKTTSGIPLTIDSGARQEPVICAAGSNQTATVTSDLLVRHNHLQARHQRLLSLFAELEQSHELYLDLYETSPVNYLTIDRSAFIIGINLTGASLLRGTHEDILGCNFTSSVTFWDLPRFRSLVRKVLRAPHQTSVDITLQRTDGSPVQTQCDYVRTVVDGKPIVRLTLVDITARKRVGAEVDRLAFYDPLTTPPNRRLLLARLQAALMHCTRTTQQGASNVAIARLIIALGHSLGLEVVAVGLEKVEQRAFLASRTCFNDQGSFSGLPELAEGLSATQSSIQTSHGVYVN